MKDTIIIHKDWLIPTDEMSDAEYRAYMEAIFAYAFEGKRPESNEHRPIMRLVFKHMDDYRAKYERICERRREAGRKGGNPNFVKGKPNPYYLGANGNNQTLPKITKDNQTLPKISHTDTDTDTDTDVPVILGTYKEKPTNVGKKKVAADTATTSAPRSVRFIRPTVEEVRAYCTERGNGVDAEAFIDFYESKGWKIGSSTMKDWRAAVRTWEKRDGRGTRKTPAAGGVTLGPGEFIDNNGRRTYGTGKATIPPDAPPRPSERHCWDKATNSWILL